MALPVHPWVSVRPPRDAEVRVQLHPPPPLKPLKLTKLYEIATATISYNFVSFNNIDHILRFL